MKTVASTGIALLLASLGAACGSAPPLELLRARSAYDQAARGQAAALDPTDVHRASETLHAAEQAYDDVGDSQDTRDLAYTAERHAELAQVRADAIGALRERDRALALVGSVQASALEQTKSELAQAQQRLAQEQAQAEEADRRAAQATAQLAHVATVRQQQRNMVITLSGSVLFAFGKADLLPDATSKLSQVATVLSQDDRQSEIVVRGYTDAIGSAATNQELSQRRADSVRDFLASHGVPGDHLKAEGLGKADPIADNSTPEGRANNRRVEIVVQPPVSSNSGPRTSK